MKINNKVLLLEEKISLLFWPLAIGKRIVSPGCGIPAGLLDIADLNKADLMAFDLTEKVFASVITSKEIEAVDSLLGDQSASCIFKRAVGNALKQLILSSIYYDKAKTLLGADADICFIPKSFNVEIYTGLLKCGTSTKDLFDIPRPIYFLFKIKEYLAAVKQRLVLSWLPLMTGLITSASQKPETPKKRYRCGILLRRTDPGISDLPNSMDFLVRSGAVKKEDVLFIMDGTSGRIGDKYASNVSAAGYDNCRFDKMMKDIGRAEYLKSIYPELKNAVKALKRSKPHGVLVLREYVSILKIIFEWEIFYLRYQVEMFFGVQEPGMIARALWQKKHGSRYCFIYLSSNEMKYVATRTYYSNIIADKLISSMIPVAEFKEQRNYFSEYHDIGILNSEIIRNLRIDDNNNKKMRTALGIEGYRKVVAVFDDNSDSYDTMPFSDVIRFSEILLQLLNEMTDTVFIYKPRVVKIFGRDLMISGLYEKIRASRNCIVIDNNQYSSFDIMGICDLVLTVPLSSTFTEALSAGIKTVCFVRQKHMVERYGDDKQWTSKLFCDDYPSVKGSTDFWLSDHGDIFLNEFMNGFTRKRIDQYCGESSFKRLNNVLAESAK